MTTFPAETAPDALSLEEPLVARPVRWSIGFGSIILDRPFPSFIYRFSPAGRLASHPTAKNNSRNRSKNQPEKATEASAPHNRNRAVEIDQTVPCRWWSFW
jgi:hypothetical protein